jgi:MYXO-CTERM domain-containing protein
MNKCLFGGALFAAGLAAHTASAQTFPFGVNFGGAYPTSIANGYAYSGGGYAYGSFVSFNPAAATGSYSLNYGTASTFASVGDSQMYAGAGTGAALDFAQAQAYAYLVVNQTIDVLIEWDFSGEDDTLDPFFSDIQVVDWSAGGTIIFAVDPSGNPLDPFAGSVVLTLNAGTNYSILLESVATDGGNSWARATVIPAPGALALVGMGGLVAARRRRA